MLYLLVDRGSTCNFRNVSRAIRGELRDELDGRSKKRHVQMPQR